MKSIYTLALFLLLSAISNQLIAQNKIGKISGSVTDLNSKGIESATVSLYRSDSSMVKVAVSDRQGVFEFENLAQGKYFLTVSAVGYRKTSSNIFNITPSDASIKVPAFQMAKLDKSLEEVTITAKKPLIENKIDRMVVNVDAAPSNAGATAMEVLEKSPGVSVTSDGVISLKGKQGVIVMIDGKQTYLSASDLADFLKNMPASALDQIELMTNPPAKYDASGNSGIINIKTKKSRNDGFNGNASVSTTGGWFRRDNTTLYPVKINTSVNLNYRKNKINVFGSAIYNYREGKGSLDLTRKFFDSAGKINSTANTLTSFNFRNNNYTAKMGMDYYADKKNVFGVVFTGFAFFGRPTPTSNQIIRAPDGTVESVLQSLTLNKINFYNYSGNFNYKHTYDSAGRELTVDLDYVGYSNHNKSMLTTDVYDTIGGNKLGGLALNGNIPGIINIYSAKSDYVRPMKKDFRLEAGFKVSYVKNDNEVSYLRDNNGSWVPDDRSNHFIYSENINAAYLSMNKKWKQWSAQFGLRLENTNATGKQVTNDSGFVRHYTNLFPTAYINYDLNKNNALTLTLGRRIDRPNYQDLNPFLFFLDSLTYQQGNPYLLPQYSNNIELRHTYKGKFSTTINYSVTNDVIAQIIKQNTAKRLSFQTTDNVARFRNVGLAINAPIEFAKWWSMNLFVNVYNNEYSGTYLNSTTGTNDPIDITFTSFSVNVSNTFTFSKGFTGELSGYYNAKGLFQLFIIDPNYFMSIGMQKTIMKGKGTLRFNFRDPFYWQHSSVKVKYSDVDLTSVNRFDSRNITINFSYRFGKSTVAQARRRQTGATEEQNRAGGGQGGG